MDLRPLPSEILRRARQQHDEAVGGVQWHDDCPAAVGRRFAALIAATTNVAYRVYARADQHRGLWSADGDVSNETASVLREAAGTDAERLDSVAAVLYAFVDLAENDNEPVEEWGNYRPGNPEYDVDVFISTANDILLGSRIDWHWENHQFVQRGSAVMHAEVVKPTTVLLESDQRFVAASRAYNTAITRLSEGKADVAITDAATALQEMFRALGVDGNSLSDQLNAATTANTITATDRKLLKPFVDWVNADRSLRGNAHHERSADASKKDAWLAIHVAGALMVRLSDLEPRDILAARASREAAAEAARRVEPKSMVKVTVLDVRAPYDDETPF